MNEELERRILAALDHPDGLHSDPVLQKQLEADPGLLAIAQDYERIDGLLRHFPVEPSLSGDELWRKIEGRLDEPAIPPRELEAAIAAPVFDDSLTTASLSPRALSGPAPANEVGARGAFTVLREPRADTRDSGVPAQVPETKKGTDRRPATLWWVGGSGLLAAAAALVLVFGTFMTSGAPVALRLTTESASGLDPGAAERGRRGASDFQGATPSPEDSAPLEDDAESLSSTAPSDPESLPGGGQRSGAADAFGNANGNEVRHSARTRNHAVAARRRPGNRAPLPRRAADSRAEGTASFDEVLGLSEEQVGSGGASRQNAVGRDDADSSRLQRAPPPAPIQPSTSGAAPPVGSATEAAPESRSAAPAAAPAEEPERSDDGGELAQEADEPTLPAEPSVSAVRAAMGQLQDQVARCTGAGATVRGRVVFISRGTVSRVRLAEPWRSRAQARCLVQVIRRARVGPFGNPTYAVDYTFQP